MSVYEHRRLLIVDDNPAIHTDFRKVLCDDAESTGDLQAAADALFDDESASTTTALPSFELTFASQGAEALELVRQSRRAGRPFALAFVDVRMPPGWDGIETVHRLWQVDPDIQVVFCTAYSDRSWQETTDMLGVTDRFLILKKPFDNVEVRQLAVALTEKWRMAAELRQLVYGLTDQVEQRTREVLATRDLTVFALAELAESRDLDTGLHLERIRGYSQLLAHELQRTGPYTDLIDEQFLEDLYRSAPLHDIGKVGIPDAILLKPGRLTPEEFDVMKRHSLIGAETLENVVRHSGSGGFLKMAAEIARYHHERFNGAGYPDGLRGRAIPLAARIVALADVWDALTTARVYKPAYDADKAREIILSETGQHFDPAIVDAFRTCYPQFLRLLADGSAKVEKIVDCRQRTVERKEEGCVPILA